MRVRRRTARSLCMEQCLGLFRRQQATVETQPHTSQLDNFIQFFLHISEKRMHCAVQTAANGNCYGCRGVYIIYMVCDE
jgi:hypothetical protein